MWGLGYANNQRYPTIQYSRDKLSLPDVSA
jgi:hypothetical protein